MIKMTNGTLQVGSILFLDKGVILFPHDGRVRTFMLFPNEEDADFWRRESPVFPAQVKSSTWVL